ncbi:ABC transporter ATP-binding protein [Halosimplex pelagicum]|uniref:ABC transporter ATP-binding protein n=1 Tax=Halosimplex pelagicum TaxID=869886 RepID=A0A7D5STI6_9EURY|nr:ABC transporter ATP-binding protein [Halosimplex pelagicum]QLH80467.1 ABC transporter ATP-binding protein [Halosimplex pelagicum]
MTVSQTDPDDPLSVSDPILTVSDLTVRFNMDRGVSRVLDDVTLEIGRNEILGVVGESGSGKSMFADSLLDAVVDPGVVTGDITYYPDSGEPVDVLELDKQERNRYRWEEVSMVFQGAMSSFNPVREIRTHFVETLSAHDEPVSEGMERARQLLSDLYLDPDRVLDAYPHELSGGMKQRALIALSLVLEPEVLVMDEPTAALDLLMQRSIISMIEELKDKYDLTIVFITHDLPLVAGLVDRLAVMYGFEFVETAPLETLLRDASHPYTRSLLKSTPNPSMPLDAMEPIVGSSPDPVDPPTGCSYHPRCPLADERCGREDPGGNRVSEDHVVACHHWEDAADAVPMPTGDGDAGDRADERTPVERDDDGGSGPDPSTEPVVSMRDVEVHFEDDGPLDSILSDPEVVRAVDGVDVDIYENDVLVLVGESGCGKTTLGKVGVALQEPTGGRVEYRGQDVWRAKKRLGEIETPYRQIRRSLQIVHQDPGSSLNSMRRVSSMLEAPLKRWQRDKSERERQELVLSMLEYVGMAPPEDYIERYPHQLSGGEKQRVALVRALLMNPEVILADEPVSALDVSLRVEIMDLMIELQERFDTSYLFVSHDLSNARYIAGKTDGRIAVMYLGEIVEVGTVDQIMNDPKHPYTRALRWATPELDLGSQESVEAGDGPMRRIDVPDPTDPPRGCRYHTRCSEVIPPAEYDFERSAWNAVMDLKVAIEREGLDRAEAEARILEDANGEPTADGSAEPLPAAVRDHFGIPEQLSDPDAERVLSTGLEHIAEGRTDAADELFRTEFETVCQTRSPETVSVTEDGPGRGVACFLESGRPE